MRLGKLWTIVFLTCAASQASAYEWTVRVCQPADRWATDAFPFDGAGATLQPASEYLQVGNSLIFAYEEYRCAMEFGLPALPAGASVVEAIVKVVPVWFSAVTSLNFHGYSGDGVATIADMVVNNHVAGPYTMWYGSVGVPVLADVTAFVQQQVASHSAYAGFGLRNPTTNQNNPPLHAGIGSSTNPTASARPVLILRLSSATAPPAPVATANDPDADGVPSACDVCPLVADPAQGDGDDDGIGDLCDTDSDNDGVLNGVDNCPATANPSQADLDGDGAGDACDDSDGDAVLDATDNCPTIYNPDQADSGGYGEGDACRSSAVIHALTSDGGTVHVDAELISPDGEPSSGFVTVSFGSTDTLANFGLGEVDGITFCYGYSSYLVPSYWCGGPYTGSNVRFAGGSGAPQSCASYQASPQRLDSLFYLGDFNWYFGGLPGTVCMIDLSTGAMTDLVISAWDGASIEYGGGSIVLAQAAYTGAFPTRLALSGAAGYEGQTLNLELSVTDGRVPEAVVEAAFVYQGEAWLAFAAADSDGDGVLDEDDACPSVSAAGADADGDGCIDSAAGLVATVAGLGLPAGTANELAVKAAGAAASAAAGNKTAAANKLGAFINAVQALLKSRRLSPSDAALLIDYARNAIAHL